MRPGWKSSQASSPGVECANLGMKYPDVSKAVLNKELSTNVSQGLAVCDGVAMGVAQLSKDKKECTVCSMACTGEPVEQCERADSMELKNDELRVAQLKRNRGYNMF